MKSTILTPYNPWPVTQGSKAEMLKHLEMLRSLGDCTVASAATRPVGSGWSTVLRREIENQGYQIKLREDEYSTKSWIQHAGILYGAFCKGLRLERAFGHSNPYHRYAFPLRWWREVTGNAELVVINYSYWAWLPTSRPKVIILHDLLSENMWGGTARETKDLCSADLVIVISKTEEIQLRRRGIRNVLWSPPVVKSAQFPLSQKVGIVGSANFHNREGLKWLESGCNDNFISLSIYGALSHYVNLINAHKVQLYHDRYTPYKDCGIILLPTALGTGVQIKAVEALACGRAIVARRGAMRGLPEDKDAWLEVDTPSEMWSKIELLINDEDKRSDLGSMARTYYEKHLNSENIRTALENAYRGLLN